MRAEPSRPRLAALRPLPALNRAAARWLALPLMKLYRWVLSPLFYALGSRCRFYPSCSHYGEEAFRLHGLAHGLALAAVRVAKCNPLHEGGVDPVPGSPLARELAREQHHRNQTTVNETHVNHAAGRNGPRAAANHSR